MASTITGSSSFSNTHTVPDDGDDLSAASAITPWQSLADNTRYLQQLTESSGVKLVRSAASLAALKALTGMADKELCWVEGLGLFFYDSGSAVTADDSMVVQPDTGSGRWLHSAYEPLNTRLVRSLYDSTSHDATWAGNAGEKVLNDVTLPTGIKTTDTIQVTAWVEIYGEADPSVTTASFLMYINGSAYGGTKTRNLVDLINYPGMRVFRWSYTGAGLVAGHALEVRLDVGGVAGDFVTLWASELRVDVWRGV